MDRSGLLALSLCCAWAVRPRNRYENISIAGRYPTIIAIAPVGPLTGQNVLRQQVHQSSLAALVLWLLPMATVPDIDFAPVDTHFVLVSKDGLIEKWIEKLAHPDYTFSEASEALLIESGILAIEQLKQAIRNHPLPKVRDRAVKILTKIKHVFLDERKRLRQEAQEAFDRRKYESMAQSYRPLTFADEPAFDDYLWIGHAHQLLEE